MLVDAERGGGALEEVVAEEERAISVITVSELLHGVHRARGEDRVRRLSAVEYLLDALPAVPITHLVARVHAELHADLSSRGVAIGAHDLWIAATALTHGLGIATHDVRDFERVPGVRLLAV